MASKYDFFWQNKIKEITSLLEKAYKGNSEFEIDVAGIRSLGIRKNWHGTVEVYDNHIKKGEMVHAKSLGNIIIKNNLLKPYKDCRFTLTISKNCKLTACKISRGSYDQARTKKPEIIDNKVIKSHDQNRRIDELIEILSEISWESWIKICEEEPEWRHMKPFLGKYGFGRFAVLMIATGLNDFQLKGKAEVAYWIPLKHIFENTDTLNTLRDIYIFLEPFYQKERYDDLKIKRLRKFLRSDLAHLLWDIKPKKAEKIFPYVWKELAKTMNQEPVAKTISFAMKCFGVALLIVGKSDFDFTHIPIPVDYRVLVFTEKAGISNSKDADYVREAWQSVLKGIQKQNKQITMLHLDSLIWQIGVLNSEELKNYFSKVGAPEIGMKLNAYLKGEPPNSKSILDSYSKPVLRNKLPNEKIVCFIPCCKSKYATGRVIEPTKILSEEELPQTWQHLNSGRVSMQYCIDNKSPKTTAFEIYTGLFYKALNKKDILHAIEKGKLSLIIVSAGYGLVNSLEPINDYDEMLSGKVAKNWKDYGLMNVIADYLLHYKPSKVYGFFAGEDLWSYTSSTYRYFYSEGVKSAINQGLEIDAGCFYREDGRGASNILTALGRVFNEFVNHGFDQNYVDHLETEGTIINNISIRYRKIGEGFLGELE